MAAAQEGVHVIGTLGILDQLFDGQYIAKDEYLYCLQEFQKHNGGEVRLPRAELKKRLDCFQRFISKSCYEPESFGTTNLVLNDSDFILICCSSATSP